MEHNTLLLSFLVSTITIITVFFISSSSRRKNLPPGSYGWPLAGETFSLLLSGKRGAFDSFILSRMKRHNPQIFKSSILGSKTAFVCGAAGNKFLFSNEHKLVTHTLPLSSRKLLKESIMMKSGTDYIRVHHQLTQFLRPDALRKYVGRMDALTKAHIATEWEGNKVVSALALAKSYTLYLGCSIFTSIEYGERMKGIGKKFEAILEGIFQFPYAVPGTRFWKACRAADAVKKELKGLIEERRAEMREGKCERDLLMHLLEANKEENGKLVSEEEIVDNVLAVLLTEGTLSTAVSFIMKYLGQMPDIYNKVLQEQNDIAMSKEPNELLTWDDVKKMNYSWNVVREVLRIWSPGPIGFREAIADINFAGYEVPKGWKLIWNTSGTHRNPEYFPEPEKFDPSRFEGKGPVPYSFVPFGGGSRMCLGHEYVRLELLIFIHNVVRKFTWELVLPDEGVTLDPLPVPAKGLPIRLFSR